MTTLIGTAVLYSLAMVGADYLIGVAMRASVRWYRWHVIKRDMARTCDRIQRRQRS